LNDFGGKQMEYIKIKLISRVPKQIDLKEKTKHKTVM